MDIVWYSHTHGIARLEYERSRLIICESRHLNEYNQWSMKGDLSEVRG